MSSFSVKQSHPIKNSFNIEEFYLSASRDWCSYSLVLILADQIVSILVIKKLFHILEKQCFVEPMFHRWMVKG